MSLGATNCPRDFAKNPFEVNIVARGNARCRQELHQQQQGDAAQQNRRHDVRLDACPTAASRVAFLPAIPPVLLSCVFLIAGIDRADVGGRHERPSVPRITSAMVCARGPGHSESSTIGGTRATVTRYIQLRVEDAPRPKKISSDATIQPAESVHRRKGMVMEQAASRPRARGLSTEAHAHISLPSCWPVVEIDAVLF
jgi:hypothetical protein